MLLPINQTPEEVEFVEIVKRRMLQRLGDDRCRFIFLYVIEQGHTQVDAAEALGVHETEVSRQMKNIRGRLHPFKKGYL